MDDRTVRWSSTATGATCMAIGVSHVVTGLRGLVGSPQGDASLDSQERFWGGIFAGYGLVWWRAGRREPPDLATVDVLCAAMTAGAVARVVSTVDRGRPHPFYVFLAAVEFVLPAWFFVMTRAARRARNDTPRPARTDGATAVRSSARVRRPGQV